MKKIILTLFFCGLGITLFANKPASLFESKANYKQSFKHNLLIGAHSALKKDSLNPNSSSAEVKDRNFVIKLNLMKAAQRVLYLQGEYAFSKKLSVALGISGTSRGLPNSITGNSSNIDFNHFRFSGFSITPELRYYPGKKREAPNGFYLAPYIKFASYSVKYPYSYQSTNSNGNVTSNNYDLKGTYTGLGGGLMIGRQWVTKSGFTIDWWILGGHYGTANASVSTKGDFTQYTKADKDEMINDMQSASEGLPFGSVHTTISITEMSTKITNFPFIGVRGFGVCLGYAF